MAKAARYAWAMNTHHTGEQPANQSSDQTGEPEPQALEQFSRRRHSFVLRMIVEADGQLHGQISEPAAADEWRERFGSLVELGRILARRLSGANDFMEPRNREKGTST